MTALVLIAFLAAMLGYPIIMWVAIVAATLKGFWFCIRVIFQVGKNIGEDKK